MNSLLSIVLLILTINITFAQNFTPDDDNSSAAIDSFCTERENPEYVKDLANSFLNMMARRNAGGLLYGGVCWWHSRFQRFGLYMTYYRPELPRPTEKEAKKLITSIRMGRVTMIPGFDNFNSFTQKYWHLIQRKLTAWQIMDGFVRQAWLIGLSGHYYTTVKSMKRKMDRLYQYVTVENNIAYQMLQIRGIDAHAWLVTSVEKFDRGYHLKVIDSNFNQTTRSYTYEFGDKALYNRYYGYFVPYLGKKFEMRRIRRNLKKFCKDR